MKLWRKLARGHNEYASKEEGKRVFHQGRKNKGAWVMPPLPSRLFSAMMQKGGYVPIVPETSSGE